MAEEESTMRLVTKRLILRDLKASDAKSITRHVNNLKVTRYLLKVPHPYSLKEAKVYLKRILLSQKKRPRDKYSFGITLKGRDEVIGHCSIENVDAFQGTATLGYWLSEDYWRQGIMTEAAEAVLDFAFRKLKLRRVNVSAFAENPASNALIKKLGFTYEGTARKKCRSKATGKIHDEHIYGLLREDWLHRNKFKASS
jgi:[ribosomal protein S5]-alanine N-acetyltransferase